MDSYSGMVDTVHSTWWVGLMVEGSGTIQNFRWQKPKTSSAATLHSRLHKRQLTIWTASV